MRWKRMRCWNWREDSREDSRKISSFKGVRRRQGVLQNGATVVRVTRKCDGHLSSDLLSFVPIVVFGTRDQTGDFYVSGTHQV